MTDNRSIRPFHLAFPVRDIQETETWYTTILGCTTGRKSEKWIDFNFFGHQVVAHLSDNIENIQTNDVDDDDIPCRHFGIILTPKDWKDLLSRFKSKKIIFEINPHTRFKGKVGEQHTMFIKDPSGNFLEFKAFENDSNIFDSNRV